MKYNFINGLVSLFCNKFNCKQKNLMQFWIIVCKLINLKSIILKTIANLISLLLSWSKYEDDTPAASCERGDQSQERQLNSNWQKYKS